MDSAGNKPPTATAPVPPAVIDLAQLVKEILDGAVGDDPLDERTTLNGACNAVERAVTQKIGRPLRDGERAKVFIETGVEFNRRRDATVRRLDIGFAEAVGLLRDADRCPDCGKTRAVINVAAHGRPFVAERITAESHCTCEGGPAHHLTQELAS